MPNKAIRVLDGLNLELHYLDNGGYEPAVRDETRKERSIFLNSPLCLNKLPVKGEYPPDCCFLPCSRCWLMDFIPADRRFEAVPCHHIPLNERGDTIADMEDSQFDERVRDAVRDWLRAKKRDVEVAGPQSQPPQVPPQPQMPAQAQAKTA